MYVRAVTKAVEVHSAQIGESAPRRIEKSAGGRPVLPMSDFAKFCGENEVSLGIINVPPEGAQDAFELLYENGIKAVWCMTPCRLSAPPDAVVEYENMVASSAYLKMQIDQRRTK